MPPRGSEGYDFTPILTHYLFLFTTILAFVGWFVAFIAQAVATSQFGHGSVGSLWFAIFLQLFLVLGVLHTIATDSIAMHRLQISVFGAVGIVFAVGGVNASIFQNPPALSAMAAGWLINAVVDILWVLYFTSEEDSLVLYAFNSMGTGGLTPPGRRRRRTQSVHNMGGNGYNAGYSAPGGNMGTIGAYDPKPNSFGGGPIGSGASFKAESVNARSNPGSINAAGSAVGGGPVGSPDIGLSSPLMGSGNAGVGAGGGPGQLAGSPATGSAPLEPISGSGVSAANGGDNFAFRAKALYAYTANPDDPNEISFNKGEIMDILDKQGKWWQAKKADGSVGIAPSNYLQML